MWGWVKRGTKVSWLLSVGLKKAKEEYYFYNPSWVQMKRFCGDVCRTHHPRKV